MHRLISQGPISIHSYEREAAMFMCRQPHERQERHTRYHGALTLVAGLWLILSLIGCSMSRKEYVVDYARGNDITARGSREHPCQTEVHCRMLAEREGVRSYWMVYQ
jgi:hypothetical protein